MPSPLPSRAVVFGGSGFIGSHLVAALAGRGVECTSFDILTPSVVPSGVRFVQGSILDPDAVREVLRDAGAVFALAGRSGAADSGAEADSDLMLNCKAQLLLLDAVRDICPEARVVFPGSRLEYGAAEPLPVTEQHPANPQSIYALHKYTAGRYHLLYHRDHGLRTTVLRISNPFGPHRPGGGNSYSVLNGMADLAVQGRDIRVFGTGEQVRDYIYISDLVEALVATVTSEEAVGHVINIGSGVPTRLVDAARAIVEAAGTGGIEFVPWPPEWKTIETGDSYFDITLAKQTLAWEPRVTLAEGLAQTVAAARRELLGGADERTR